MFRRRLFCYTIMYICGIVCGYVLCEMTKALAAALLLMSIGMAICLVGRYRDIDAEIADCTITDAERKRLFVSLLLGFGMFVMTFINFSASSFDTNGADGEYSIAGSIKEIRERDYGYELIVRPVNSDIRGLVRIALIDEDKRIFESAESESSSGIYGLIGDDIKTKCRLSKPRGRDNPGGFDYRLYLLSRGVNYTASVRNIEIIKNESVYHKLHCNLMDARSYFEHSFDREPEYEGLIRGIIFGDKGEIDEDVRDEFNENGTGHILAVSGLHIGFLFALLSWALKKRRTFGVNVIIIIAIYMYGEMTMWSPSTIRATIVMAVSLMSSTLLRKSDLLTSVSFAALMLLTSNPYQLFNTGFQMSFLAMLGIAFLTKPLSYFIGEYFAIIVAVQIAIAPFTAYTFNRFNPLSAIVNIPITLIASVLVPASIVAIGVGALLGSIPSLLYEIICGLVDLLLRINHLLNFDGSWSFDCTRINAGALIAIYIIIFIISSEWMRVQLIRRAYKTILSSVALLALPIIIICIALANPFIDDELVFLSVGQGDALHIRCGDNDVMIDGGGSFDKNVGEDILKPYLLSNGASDVDIAMLTHLHTDHYKGIEELSGVYPVRTITLSSQYAGSYKAACSNTRFINSSDIIRLGKDCYIKPIWPIVSHSQGKISSDDANEYNMVYMIFYKGIKTMVTGDLLENDELQMVQYYSGTDVLKCDILKVAHHGSKSSSCEAVLDAAKPKIAIISVGANNMYGHPHTQTIERLEERGIEIYRTDENGAVGIDINRKGDSFKVDTVREKAS